MRDLTLIYISHNDKKKDQIMSRTCDLTGKRRQVGNKVSHSNIKTKSTAHPNIQNKRVYSQALNSFIAFKLATSTLRTLEHKGGLDPYILKQDDLKLSKRALTVKNKIKSKLSRPPKAKTEKK